MNFGELNFEKFLHEFGGNANYDDFWNLFFTYKFKKVPEINDFIIAFGEDEGKAYFYQTKNLVKNFWNAVNACATFDGQYKDILFEINNPEEYAKRPKGHTHEMFELFFGGMEGYEKQKKEEQDTRNEMKNMIIKFGVDKTKAVLFDVFSKYLKEVLEHIGVDKIDEIASNVKYDNCFLNMEDMDEGFEEEYDLKLLANFVKENVLPQLKGED